MVPRTAFLRLWPWRDCVKCVIAQRQLSSRPDDRRIASAAVYVTSCKRAVFLICQRVLAPASERARNRRVGPPSPSAPLPAGAARQAFGRHVMEPVHACRYAWSSTSGRLPGSFRACRIFAVSSCGACAWLQLQIIQFCVCADRGGCAAVSSQCSRLAVMVATTWSSSSPGIPCSGTAR